MDQSPTGGLVERTRRNHWLFLLAMRRLPDMQLEIEPACDFTPTCKKFQDLPIPKTQQ